MSIIPPGGGGGSGDDWGDEISTQPHDEIPSDKSNLKTIKEGQTDLSTILSEQPSLEQTDAKPLDQLEKNNLMMVECAVASFKVKELKEEVRELKAELKNVKTEIRENQKAISAQTQHIDKINKEKDALITEAGNDIVVHFTTPQGEAVVTFLNLNDPEHRKAFENGHRGIQKDTLTFDFASPEILEAARKAKFIDRSGDQIHPKKLGTLLKNEEKKLEKRGDKYLKEIDRLNEEIKTANVKLASLHHRHKELEGRKRTLEQAITIKMAAIQQLQQQMHMVSAPKANLPLEFPKFPHKCVARDNKDEKAYLLSKANFDQWEKANSINNEKQALRVLFKAELANRIKIKNAEEKTEKNIHELKQLHERRDILSDLIKEEDELEDLENQLELHSTNPEAKTAIERKIEEKRFQINALDGFNNKFIPPAQAA